MNNKVSIVVPVYNEARSLPELTSRLGGVLENLSRDYEIIFVNDGSKDETPKVLNRLAEENSRVKVLHLQKNYGQTAAIAAGLEHATGETIVLIDSDLENHPEDIPRLLAKLSEGYDVVSGWRQDRWQNQMLSRRLPSWAANKLISSLSGLDLNDYGCTLKAYKAPAIKGIRLYGDMHRFIPAYLAWQGSRVAELPVSYTPRKYGHSKYNLNRTFKVVLDLVALKFLTRYFNKPMHFFGGAGLASIFLGAISGGAAVYFKFSTAHHKDFIQTPLPVLTALFAIVGVLFILMGLLAEIMVRVYHESQNKTVHVVKEKINF
jgi:glycosyltransferase involved in cell wall biosynthesis